jgi:hypothetical protein
MTILNKLKQILERFMDHSSMMGRQETMEDFGDLLPIMGANSTPVLAP